MADQPFSDRALAYLAERAIDPAVAEAAGVRECPDGLAFPYVDGDGRYERLRLWSPNGARFRQPRGRRLTLWWPRGRPAASDAGWVLVCEGESDALAAATALAACPLPDYTTAPVCALPGATVAGRLGAELAALGVREAAICFDADDAGRQATATARESLRRAGIRPVAVGLADGHDLADAAAAVGPTRRGEWIATLLLDSSAAAPAPDPAPGGADDEPQIRFVPADELLADAPPEPDWMWEGALVHGAVTLLAGKPKAGKSTLLYALAEAAAKREAAFLGRALKGGPVLYVSEEGIATLAGSFPRHPDVHLLTRESAWPKPGWAELVTAAAAKARELEAALAIVDSFAFWAALERDAEKDAGAVQQPLDQLAQIASAGPAVLLVHHHRKSGGEDGDAIRGSGAIVGAVDAFAELERVEDAPANHRRLVVTSRWPCPLVLLVSWDEVFGYRVIGQAADRAQAGEVGWDERLLAAVPTTGDGATMDELAELLDADRRKWHRQLAKLIDDGLVTRTGRGDRYSPYHHLRAAVPGSRPDRQDGGDGSTPTAPPSSRPIEDGGGAVAAIHQHHHPDGGRTADGGAADTAADPDHELERLRRKGLA